ncbi:MAG TPA: hypothetical protein PKV26_08355 [Bacillota bacterium]|nr:hypothetical protein [Peptococcaceae bacterium]HQD76672.1 hypothetical protein [Bacillota bacterium]
MLSRGKEPVPRPPGRQENRPPASPLPCSMSLQPRPLENQDNHPPGYLDVAPGCGGVPWLWAESTVPVSGIIR